MSNRARTRERRKQREQERKRNRQLLIVIAIAAIAIIAVVLVVIANQPAEAPIPEVAFAEYVDVQQSVNEDGFPVLGDPEAPVQVMEYSSFDCPHCAEFHSDVTPALVERAQTGEISFTYVPLYGTGGVPNGQGAARAAICAAEQDTFWTYHTALFTWQGTYGNQAFAGNRLQTGIDNLGIDAGAWSSCFGSDRPDEVLVAANGAANRLEGFSGTPTVTVNGVIVTDANGNSSPLLNDVNAAIDVALASAPPPVVNETVEEATPVEEETAEEATEEPDDEPVEEAAEEEPEATEDAGE